MIPVATLVFKLRLNVHNNYRVAQQQCRGTSLHVQYRVSHVVGWSWANIYDSSVGWLENTRMSTQPICYLYWKESTTPV